jgi:2-dehydro-3-deoxyphosphogluconate aldolase / (4S)-4-hydroxy-2-oxoglutarate aldolase
MNNKDNSTNIIIESGIVPVFYNDNIDVCTQVAVLCFEAGIRVFEFTNRGPHAHANFIALRQFMDVHCKGMQLGAGTIFKIEDAKKFIDAGADFIVSPALVPEMKSVQVDYDKLWIPGCATISELVYAQNLGASFMKAFPADILGPKFVSAAISIMPSLLIMPTGGIEPTYESLSKWFSSGVSAVGMGSQLFSKDLIASKDWKTLSLKVKDTFSEIRLKNK